MRRSGLLALTWLAGGCTYVSQSVFEARRAEIDEDGDGVPFKDDCDDLDPDRSPAAGEKPYDGIDNDCRAGDAVDLDGDGFPGILQADYEAIAEAPPYPEEFVDMPLDCADDPATEPTAANIYPDPTGTIEALYDGIDGDCGQDSDFDGDFDGYMPNTVLVAGTEIGIEQALADYLERWSISPELAATWGPDGTGPALAGDCDDTDPDVHPDNATADVWYDGIDRDCDDRNDFDQDGDCFMPPDAASQYAAYVARYYGVGTPPFCVDPDLPFDDCLDETDADLLIFPTFVVADPATVHPSTATAPVADAPYDGIDADCGGQNDFDEDGDGFMPTNVSGTDTLTLLPGYITDWGFDAATQANWVAGNPDAGLATPAPGDCDDTRFDSWPGALEIVGDGIDQDCNSAIDSAPFAFGDATVDFDWTNPTNPEIARLADTYVVLVGGEHVEVPAVSQESGVALPFPLASARGGPSPVLPYPNWKAPSASLEIQPLLDAAMVESPDDVDSDGIGDPTVRTLSNADNNLTTYTHLSVNGIQLLTSSGNLSNPGGTTDFITTPYESLGIDLAIDGNGAPFSLACAPSRLHALYDIDVPQPRVTLTTSGGEACFFDGSPVLAGQWTVDFVLCEFGVCEDWTLTDDPSFVPGPVDGDDWIYGDQDEGWISLIDSANDGWIRDGVNGGAAIRVFQGEVVLHLDVAELGGVLYVAGVLDGTPNEVWLTYGTAGNFDAVRLPYDDPSTAGENPQWVAVHADADRVAVAVTALTGVPTLDSVGWTFLGPAP